MKRAIVFFGVVTFLLSSAGLAQDSEWFTLEARQWTAEPSGTVAINEPFISEVLNLEGDLGLDEDESTEGRLIFRPSKKTMIRVGYLPEIALAGDNVLSRSFEFLGQVFNINERVVTDLELEYGRLGFAWMGLSYGGVRFGPMVEIKGFSGTLTLVAPDGQLGISASEEFEAAFASAGVIAEVQLTRRIQLFGETSVLVESDEGDLTDTEFGLRIRVIPRLGIVAGTRKIDIDVQEDDDTLDFEIDGVFLGANVHF